MRNARLHPTSAGRLGQILSKVAKGCSACNGNYAKCGNRDTGARVKAINEQNQHHRREDRACKKSDANRH